MDDVRLRGQVLASYYGKALVIADNRYFILRGQHRLGETVEFTGAEALPMPSYLFGMAALNEPDLDSALDYIHSRWFQG